MLLLIVLFKSGHLVALSQSIGFLIHQESLRSAISRFIDQVDVHKIFEACTMCKIYMHSSEQLTPTGVEAQGPAAIYRNNTNHWSFSCSATSVDIQ